MADKKRSKWEDWCYLPPYAMLTLVPVISCLAIGATLSVFNFLHRSISAAQQVGDTTILWSSLAVATLGVVLLFFARLPLYRQRRFFTFGPGALPPGHRKLYNAAYAVIVPSVIFLAILACVVR